MKEETYSFKQWFASKPWEKWRRIGVVDIGGSFGAYFVFRLREKIEGQFLIILPSLQDGEAFFEDLKFFKNDIEGNLYLFPESQNLPYDGIPPHPEILVKRISALYNLLKNGNLTIVSTIKALMQKVISPSRLKESTFSLFLGEEVERDQLVNFLNTNGYILTKIVEERGDYSLRGSIIDIYSPLYEDPLRLEFDGDHLLSIRRFDPETQRSIIDGSLEEVILLTMRDTTKSISDEPMVTLMDYLKEDGVIFICERDEAIRVSEDYNKLIQRSYEKVCRERDSILPVETIYIDSEDLFNQFERFRIFFLERGPIPPLQCDEFIRSSTEGNEDLQREIKALLSVKRDYSGASPFSIFLKRLHEWEEKGFRIFIVSHTTQQANRLMDIFLHYGVKCYLAGEKGFHEAMDYENDAPLLLIGSLYSGFKNPEEKWILLTEEEIFGERRRLKGQRIRRTVAKDKEAILSSYHELQENNFIVHSDYGLGIYRGLRHLKIGGVANDYLLLEYLDGDKLYLPVDRLNLIQRYIGGDGREPRLDKLGGRSWERRKKRVKAALSEIVKELIDLYAERQALKGISFSPPDQYYREFEATFEYEETPDQAKAIAEVMEDMGNPKPMDRLICGDVGYGKTEVAIRAAYRAVMDGKQVAILVPTTVLAQQHYQTFIDRFKNYPVSIEVLSRFKTQQDQKGILQRLSEGKVDIIIGTHRLLQKDVVFHDLGLVVVDEEHRFGVLQKEKLKQMRRLVDVMTMTATPIPRTLQMALSGIRDLSLIQTPPENRLSIRTFVIRYDDEIVEDAIRKEILRGGQVFFVHHRVQDIYAMANHLKKLIPEASLAIAHGQMREGELERVMYRFVKKEYNVLVCTSIIESGLDIPTANTILINHAENFGLADLYQLRGRVGRGNEQAYAYLLIPSDLTLSRDQVRRLRAIQELSELGSGFRLALQDLEIRGAGNFFGPSQSGHIASVGLELYSQLLEKAICELKGEEILEEITPEIHFHLPAFIPESYIEDQTERLNLYRRLSFCRSDESVEMIREELIDRFGRIPEEVDRLLEVIKVKIILTKLSIQKFEETSSRLILTFDEKTKVSPQKVLDLITRGEGRYRLTPDSRLIIEWPELKKNPFGETRKLLQALV